MSATLVMVTAPSGEVARALGRALVEARLAASVNISTGVTSYYWWEGAVREGAEALLFAKTRGDLVDRVIEFVKARHPYVCPAVVATPIVAGNPDYLAWIERETGDG
jgi:periplasmic divalent cation tolerance protein